VAEQPPFADASFDIVVATNVLCSVQDVAAALAQIRRVLKPGGRYVFVEHIAAPPSNLPLRSAQALLDPLQAALADNCHFMRDPLPLLEACSSGFARLEAARFSLDDDQAIASAAASRSAIATLRSSSADGGAGWTVGAPLRPHFLLSPHCIGVATA